MFESIAYAMSQGGAAGGQQGGFDFNVIGMMLVIFAIFYFLLIRPQQKKVKEHQEMINNLKKGDRVVTSGGIHGLITAVDETCFTVEIADRVRIKVSRGNISALDQSQAKPKEKPKKNGK